MDIVILGFITAFFIVLLATPSLIKVAKLKRLVDEPSEARKLHISSVPTIGGIIIFAGFIFAYALWFPTEDRNYFYDPYNDLLQAFDQFKYMIASLLILFFIGVKDDIIGTAPLYKLVGHMLVAFILVLMADVRIESMHGLFGYEQIPDWFSIMLSVFTYVVIVNGFNLIDGVDGLAAGVGMIACAFFALWFYMAGDIPLTLLASCLAGALFAFLIFNFHPARIFMGDSGSMLIGAVMSVLAIMMVEHDTSKLPESIMHISTPVLAMSILSYPLVDTLRVFMLRALAGNSPFLADKNHIHHKLLSSGLNHSRTALAVYLLNISLVMINLLFMQLNVTLAFLLMLASATLLYHLPLLIRSRKKV
ncbi:MAG: undecaprenyl/decaprenyl-phosphate alpha-N-acetylglucosaminyl 1-phosphate transferase [Flavobacteriales bacterium]|nr:undecaprenyl/decaprenyl-phosphate alpha-N-acetylglucosaminyl 1-phosphate transferase [Flavobacteriales bacterium]